MTKLPRAGPYDVIVIDTIKSFKLTLHIVLVDFNGILGPTGKSLVKWTSCCSIDP